MGEAFQSQVVTVEQAAVMLGIGRSLAYDLAKSGSLPGAIRLGAKRIVVSLPALQRALEGDATPHAPCEAGR